MTQPKKSTAPRGMHSVSPHLVCAGAADAIEFYKKAFGAVEKIRLAGKDGRLMQPYDVEVDTGAAYWLAFPEGRRNVPKIKAFRDWILGEIGENASGA